ncbi:hypothetical protein OAD97_00615 [bacterium]|nr:hypothetical protein [bacterium]
MKELYRFRQFLAEGVIKENISSHKEEAKRFLEKFVDDNEDKFEFIPDLETGYIDVNDNSYNVDELASIFLDIGQDIPRGTHNQKYKGEGGTYVVVSEGVIKEEVDVLGDEFTQEIQDDMKMYYKMDVDMGDIKDWVNMYYIGYNSEYDEGPGDVDYEGNEFGSEDYESEKKELVFDTAEREDFYMHLNPEADSTFPNLAEGKILKENSPGYSTRKQGEALPTSESIKAAYEAKNNIKEDEDYDTDGYVEAMGRDLDEHVDAIVRIFTEWKNGPMTEPGMEGYAKDDLVDYIQMKIRNA